MATVPTIDPIERPKFFKEQAGNWANSRCLLVDQRGPAGCRAWAAIIRGRESRLACTGVPVSARTGRHKAQGGAAHQRA